LFNDVVIFASPLWTFARKAEAGIEEHRKDEQHNQFGVHLLYAQHSTCVLAM
jgi:hypothetical protein